MSHPPIPCVWDGDAFYPKRGFKAKCDSLFVVGETYTLEIREDRSAKSHRFYFAAVNEAFANLPESMAERFPTADHLRRFALIRTGYADRREIVCSSKAEARRVAAFVKPMDEYALVTATECVVTVWTAQSQSTRAMGRAAFAKSKDDVLGLLAEMIGVTVESLKSAEAA